MENQPSADLNRLSHILRASKKVMDKVETGDFTPTGINAESLVTHGELLSNLPSNAPIRTTKASLSEVDERNALVNDKNLIMNSNLPDVVKKYMIDKPINVHAPKSKTSFTREDILGSDADEKPMGIPKITNIKPKAITENYNPNMITIDKNELKSYIQEEMINSLLKERDKKLIDETIKRTITTLIKEGKMKR
jgi:hypothetical protein